MGFAAARLVAAVMLFWALARNPYSYYTTLRWVVFGVSVYALVVAIRQAREGWAWAFGLVALLFNPVFVVRLERSVWALIDSVAAAIFMASIGLLWHPPQPDLPGAVRRRYERWLRAKRLASIASFRRRRDLEWEQGVPPAVRDQHELWPGMPVDFRLQWEGTGVPWDRIRQDEQYQMENFPERYLDHARWRELTWFHRLGRIGLWLQAVLMFGIVAVFCVGVGAVICAILWALFSSLL